MSAQQPESIQHLQLMLDLYPNQIQSVFKEYASKIDSYYWFAVAKDGECGLFKSDGKLDDVSKIKKFKAILTGAYFANTIKKIVIPSSVVTIDRAAFAYRTGLEEVVLQDGVKLIEVDAFRASGIKHMKIPSTIEIIRRGAFMSCRNLESIDIPDTVRMIKDDAFYGCESLKSFKIPRSIKDVMPIINDCGSLEKVFVPSTVSSMPHNMFEGCFNLEEVVFEGKTFAQVKEMPGFPFNLEDLGAIKCI